MQHGKEDLSLSLSLGKCVTTNNNNRMISHGLYDPYVQQAHTFNNLLQNHMTKGLYNQFNLLEERAVACMKEKDKALQAMMMTCQEMEIRLKKAVEEAETWKNISNDKTALCEELSSRLLKMKRKQKSKTTTERKIDDDDDDAESSTGENGVTMMCKRRRV